MNFWVLVANAAQATLYETKSLYKGPLTILKQFSHQESRQKGEDLISDRFGNYHEKNSPGSAFERIDPKKIESEKFAISLADVLKKGHAQHQYEKLIIVAEAHFYGLLKQHLPNISNLIHLNKEYIGLSEKELLAQLTTLLP
jgi:protein required for attachment to host cells